MAPQTKLTLQRNRAPILTKINKIKAGSRPAIGVAINGVSSIGNLALAIAIARSGSVEQFGHFAIAFSIYVLSVGLCRAAVTDSVLAEVLDPDRHRKSAQGIQIISCASGLLTAAAGLATGSVYLMVLAPTLPGLAIYEHIKALNIGVGSPARAFAQEAVWTVATAGVVGLATITDAESVMILAGWSISGALIGLFHARFLRYSFLPRWHGTKAEARTAVSFGLQYLTGSGIAQLTTSLLASIAGASVVGAIRAAGTLLAPGTLIVSTARGLLVPYLFRSGTSNCPTNPRTAVKLCIAICLLIAPLGAALMFLPDTIGNSFLGDSWKYARPVLPALAGELVFASITAVAFAAHRVHGAGVRGLGIETSIAPFRVVAIVWAGSEFGAIGAASAMMAIAIVGAFAWWFSYLALNRRAQRKTESDDPIVHPATPADTPE